MFTRPTREDSEPVTGAQTAALLEAAAAPVEPGSQPGETAALAAFRASCACTDARRPRMHTPLTPLRAVVAAAAGAGLLLTGGVAGAAGGMLPGAAQDKAHDMLAKIGVEVPGPNEHAAGHADTRGRSAKAPASGTARATEAEPTSGENGGASGKGETISELARTTESTGVAKGAEISEAASDGTSRAGQPMPSAAQEQPAATSDSGGEGAAEARADREEAASAGDQSGDHARVETPDNGGTDTAEDASAESLAGAPTDGTDIAESASGERSVAGSENRPPDLQ
jgi:hypothetical protein